MGWQDAPVVDNATQSAQPAWMSAPEVAPSYGERVAQTGAAFDKAAGPGVAGLGRTAVAAGEDALAMGSGVAGDIAGAATSIATQNPKRGEAVKQALTYQPKTAAGKAGQQYIGALLQPVGAAFEKPVQALDKAGHPILAQTAQAVEDVAPLRIPKALGAAREAVRPAAEAVAKAGEERTAVRAAEEAPKQAKIEQAKSIGLKIPPSEAGGPVGKALEGASGKIQTEMAFSRDNAKAINRTAAKEIGLSDKQPLTEGNIDRLKQKAFDVYKRVKQSGRVAADKKFTDELNAVKERSAKEEADYPEDTNEQVDKEIQKFNKPSADAESMVGRIKSLRNRAAANMKALDPEKFELGVAQKKIATAMENLIERHVAQTAPTLIKEFRAARTQLAKIYNVEDALGPNGNLSAAVLARQLKRHVPLSGGLKTIAETYQEFPKVMRYVDSLGGHAPFSALDYLVGGVEAVANPHKAAAIVGALAGRPVARAIIRSRPYQSVAVHAREVKPSVTTRAARRLAGPASGNTLETMAPAESGTMTLKDEGQ